MVYIFFALVVLSVLLGAYFAYQAWRFQNPAIPKIEENKIHIACIGDSITFGAGVARKRKTSTYPIFLQRLVGKRYQVLNYGLSGRTLLDEGDMPYRKEAFYQKSLDIHADIYIIMLGTNDSKPYNWNAKKYEAQLSSFVKEYQRAQKISCIYLMQPSKCYPQEKKGIVAFDIQEEMIQSEIYQIVKRVAEHTNVELIDLHTFTDNHSEWFTDGVHLMK